MTTARPQTAVRDSTVALTTSVVLCTALALYAGIAAMTGAAVIAGIGVVAGAALAVGSRADRWSGPADRVTLARTVLIGGCATVVVLALAGSIPFRAWWLVALAAPALLLDAVDGAVARRTGTASAAGARLDMEMDAALLVVLSVAAASPVGAWVLAIGAMRYAYVAASWVRPALRRPPPVSALRRPVAALQGVALLVALVPVVPLPAARAGAAVALALLVVSFGRDVLALERAAAVPAPAAGRVPDQRRPAATEPATAGFRPAASRRSRHRTPPVPPAPGPTS